MYKLYNFQRSGNCYKIRLLLTQLGIPFELVQVNILNKESRTQDFLGKNPNGRVPVLQQGEKYLPESNAILWYLAQNTNFLPKDKFEQAQVLQWMFFEQYSHEPNIATVRYWISILRAEAKFLYQIEQKRKAGYAALDVMETHLSSHSYFVGEKYSIADIALYAYTHVAHEGDFNLSKYKNIKKWFKSVELQPNHVTLEDS
jgi:glutathione S-transferase